MIGGLLAFGLVVSVLFGIGSLLYNGAQWAIDAFNPPAARTYTVTVSSDPQFSWCYEAQDAGYGPYHEGEVEYEWYTDRDSDGVVCE